MVEASVKFIKDEPASSDDFGAHTRVAKALHRVLRTQGIGKTIGLIGAWGGGKSTVIRNLIDLVETQNNSQDHDRERVVIFQYDAWLYQSDPPRRSFLEKLTQFLCSEFERPPLDHWTKELNRLKKREEESRTVSAPKLTTQGKLFALAGLMVPLGLVAVSSEQIGWYFDAFGFYLGLVLALSPILVLAVTYLMWRPWSAFPSKAFWFNHKYKENQESLLSLFIGQASVETLTRTSATADPTAIEFQEYFDALMAAYVSGDVLLLIVIDNLDRIPTPEALFLWSAIRSFFLERNLATQAGDRRIAVVVPFDPSATETLFGSVHQSNSESLDSHEIHSLDHVGVDSNASGRLDAFIDKTFDVTFHVNPPILSDWRDYFLKKALEVFGEDQEREIRKLVNIYEANLTRTQSELLVTPRKIVKTINNIAALFLQWDSDISLSLVGLYEIHRETIQNDFNVSVAAGEIVDAHLSRIIQEPQWRDYLAAIHFGIPVNKALQAVLAPTVSSLLAASEQSEKLPEYFDAPGFWSVVRKVISSTKERWRAERPHVFAYIANNFRDQADKRPEEYHEIITSMIDVMQNTARWAKLPASTPFLFNELLRCSTANEAKKLLDGCLRVLSEFAVVKDEPFELEEDTPTIWADSLVAMLNGAERKEVTLHAETIEVPLDVEFFLDVVGRLGELDENIALGHLGAPRGRDEANFIQNLSDEIVRRIASNAANAVDGSSIVSLVEAKPKWNFAPLASGLGSYLETLPNFMGQPIEHAIRLLFDLEQFTVGEVQAMALQALNRITRNGTIFNALHQLHIHKEFASASWCLWAVLRHNSALEAAAEKGKSAKMRGGFIGHLESIASENSPYQEAVLKCLFEWATFQDVVTMLANGQVPGENFSRFIWSAALEHKFSIAEAEVHFPQNIDSLIALTGKKDVQKFAGRLERGHQFLESLKALPFGELSPDFLLFCLRIEGDLNRCAKDKIKEHVQSIDEETWATALREESHIVNLMLATQSQGVSLNLGGAFLGALEVYARSVIARQNYPHRLLPRWANLDECLDHSARQTYWRNVADVISHPNQNDAGGKILLLTIMGDAFLSSGIVSSHADKIIRHVFIPSVSADVKVMGDFCTTHSAWLLSILQKSSPDARTLFEAEVARNAAAGDEDKREVLLNIARALNLEIAPSSTSDGVGL